MALEGMYRVLMSVYDFSKTSFEVLLGAYTGLCSSSCMSREGMYRILMSVHDFSKRHLKFCWVCI